MHVKQLKLIACVVVCKSTRNETKRNEKPTLIQQINVRKLAKR